MTTAYDVALERVQEAKRTGATELNLIGGEIGDGIGTVDAV